MRAYLSFALLLGISQPTLADQPLRVTIDIVENLTDKDPWDWSMAQTAEQIQRPYFHLSSLPPKYNERGIQIDRPALFGLRFSASVPLVNTTRLLLRSRCGARLFVDDKLLAEIAPPKPGNDGHNPVVRPPKPLDPSLPLLRLGEVEKLVTLPGSSTPCKIRLEVLVGGGKRRPELGETFLAIAAEKGQFALLSPHGRGELLTPETHDTLTLQAQADVARQAAQIRHDRSEGERAFWNRRHELARRVAEKWPLPAAASVDGLIDARLKAAGVTPPDVIDDFRFVRRVYLDTVGVPPSPQEIEAFFALPAPERRRLVIDRLLADPRRADHWVSYWQDVLAENPGILKPTLNNTGPFRYYLHAALSDNWGLDRFATELIRMDGSKNYGGPAGFAIATQNDVPMAAKATTLARAFLAVDLQCARCHDAPNRGFKQEQLFQFAALLEEKPIKLPKTSSVPKNEGGRQPNVKISLKPGQDVQPGWLFDNIATRTFPEGVAGTKAQGRELAAAILTSPENVRFARVLVNRIWARLLGWGLIDPIDDWADAVVRHEPLLAWLSRELVMNGYDQRHLERLILNSAVYQRTALSESYLKQHEDARLAGPARRRLTAEQILDSLFVVSGKSFDVEELSFDPDGKLPVSQCQNFGRPRRAWELVGLANERDRPSLALPRAQALVDVLQAYGWRENRANSLTVRDDLPTPLQPMTLANGLILGRVARLSDDGAFVALCREERPLSEMIDQLFLRILNRPPTGEERSTVFEVLSEGYDSRRVEAPLTRTPRSVRLVTWSNHLKDEANRLKLVDEQLARQGDTPTRRLTTDWRLRAEDVVWALMNSPEFVFIP